MSGVKYLSPGVIFLKVKIVWDIRVKCKKISSIVNEFLCLRMKVKTG